MAPNTMMAGDEGEENSDGVFGLRFLKEGLTMKTHSMEQA